MQLEERLKQIKTNWLNIKEKDPGYTAPGAMFHKYYLDQENIPRQGIENFENHNGFKLPEEYREYLIRVSNGGAGPFNIMYPLHDALYPLNRGTKGTDGYYDWLEENMDHYTSEFPVTEEQICLADLAEGDHWEVTFKVNGLDCIYIYTVKEIVPCKTVDGKEYTDVVMVELESFYLINGTRIAMNAFTQNYYAKGVGVILTNTSGVIGNNSYPLVSYDLK